MSHRPHMSRPYMSHHVTNPVQNLGSSVTTRRKNWERITVLGAFGIISEIQRAKFGVSVTYIFGGKIWGSDMNFRGKIWGQAPRPLIWKYPLWGKKRDSKMGLLVQTTTFLPLLWRANTLDEN